MPEVRPMTRLPEGVRATLPVFLPTAAVGVSFGLLAAPLIGVVPAIVMSALVWSGTAQFGALSILAGGGGAVLAAGTGLLTNTRFLPMGFAVAPSMTAGPWRRLAVGSLVADVSFVIGSRPGGRFDIAAIVWAAPLQYLGWLSGTVTGALGATAIGDPGRFGLDVLFPVFYLSILMPELRPKRRAKPHAKPEAEPMPGASAETRQPSEEPHPPDHLAADQRPTDRHPVAQHPTGGRYRPLIAVVLGALVALALTPFAPTGVPVLAAAVVALIGLKGPSVGRGTPPEEVTP